MKTKQFFLFVALFCCATQMFAHDAEIDGIFYNFAGDSATVTYKGSSYYSYEDYLERYTGNVVIPESVTYNDISYRVAAIGDNAFYGCTGLTSVAIPNTVTMIGSRAFYGCTSLMSVTIPESIITIDSWTFHDCTSLTSIIIPNSVTSIGQGAFGGTGLTSVMIPCNVNSIGSNAFSYCANLTSVEWNAKNCNNKHYAKLFENSSSITTFIFGDEVEHIPAVLCSSLNSLTSVTIGKNVTTIGEQAFGYCSSLTSITIPDNVMKIESSAFSGCSKLESVTIGKSVTSISSAFSDCSSLASVTWNAKNYPNANNATSPFYGLSSIATFVFGDAVDSIPAGLCSGLNNLTSVTIGDNVTAIGSAAFSGCTSLISITLPDSLTSIDESVFSYCSNLTSITIPENMTFIDDEAFLDCSGLTSVTWNAKNYADEWFVTSPFSGLSSITSFVFGDKVEHIPTYLCYELTGLTSIIIPSSVTSIGRFAFEGCSGISSVLWNAKNCAVDVQSPAYAPFYDLSSITSFTFGDSVEYIPTNLCRYLTSLTSVTIGKNVTSMGNDVFSGCSSLESVTWNAKHCTYSNPFADLSSITSVTFGDEVAYIPNYLCYGFTGLTAVTLPNSVREIGYGAFSGCTNIAKTNYIGDMAGWCAIKFNSSTACPMYYSHNLYLNDVEVKELVIPSSITSIGDYAFEYCTSLTSVIIHKDVTSIGLYAFSGCTNLETIVVEEGNARYHTAGNCLIETAPKILIAGCKNSVIPTDNSVTSIAAHAFENCIGLPSVTIPNSVTTIGSSAFYGCSGLTSALLSESLTTIGSSAFYGCSSLESIAIPEGVRFIENYTFRNCSALEFVTLNSQLYRIGECAFYDCVSLREIQMPNTVTDLGRWAFYGCTSLKKANVSTQVKVIRKSTFCNCSSLESIIIPESIDTIGIYAFADCASLASVVVPNNVKVIEDYAFRNNLALTSLTLGENISTLGAYVFYGCSELSSITWNVKTYANFTRNNAPFQNSTKVNIFTIGDSVEYVPSYLCYGLSALREVTIGKNVVEMGRAPFSGCSALSKTNYTGDIAGWCALDFLARGSNPIYYSHNFYLNDVEVKDLVIPDSVAKIGTYAFVNCSCLQSITVGANVTTIGMGAFQSCSGLTSVTWNAKHCDDMTSTTGPFSENTSITSFTFGDSVQHIPGYLCFGLLGIDDIAIGKNVASIGDFAFGRCSNLADITVVDGNSTYHASGDCLIETAAKRLVLGCKNSVIPADATVTKIGYGAFSGCSGLTSINIPNGVTEIDGYAFSNCENLTSVTIPNSMTEIGASAFNNSSAITYKEQDNACYLGNAENPYHALIKTINTDITTCLIHTDTKVLADMAFLSCKNLTTIHIPNNITKLSSGLFYNAGLTTIDIPNSVTVIDQAVFNSCSALTKVTIPHSVTSIGMYAFAGCTQLQEMTCLATTPPVVEETTFNLVSRDIPLKVPSGALALYQDDTYWSEFNLQGIEQDVTTIESVSAEDNTLHLRKVLENGTIYILRGGEKYTVDGVRIK